MGALMDALYTNKQETTCTRCGGKGYNVFRLRGTFMSDLYKEEDVYGVYCDKCANYLMNFMLFFNTLDDKALGEIEEVFKKNSKLYREAETDVRPYDWGTEKFAPESKPDFKEEEDLKEQVEAIIAAEKEDIDDNDNDNDGDSDGSNELPKEIMDLIGGIFDSMSKEFPDFEKEIKGIAVGEISKDKNGKPKVKVHKVSPPKAKKPAKTEENSYTITQKPTKPVIERVEQLVRNGVHQDFGEFLEGVMRFVSTLNPEERREVLKYSNDMLKNFKKSED